QNAPARRALPRRPRQALPTRGQAAGDAGAPHLSDDDVPRDGHALLAGASRSGDEGGSAMSTTKTPLSEIISVADLAWPERQPGVRLKSSGEQAETKRRAVVTRSELDAQPPLP